MNNAEPSTALTLRSISKLYDGQAAIASMDLDVATGEFVTLLGPSGCGKSTTLGVIAGFLEPDNGEVSLYGKPLVGQPPFRRDIGVVFQDYAIFPHMTVAQNVGYGLKVRKVPPKEIDARVGEMLAMVRLDGLGHRMPQALSGGQRQRVALARALVFKPKFLLLDEPLSNLDLKLREEMRSEIVRLQREMGIATIFVTHDQSEALVMSDRIAVMQKGRIEQIGSPQNIYREPANRFVAEFIGSMNLIEGRVLESSAQDCLAEIAGGTLRARARRKFDVGERMLIAVRPEKCRIGVSPPPACMNAIAATVARKEYLGGHFEVSFTVPGGSEFLAHLDEADLNDAAPGTELSLTFPVDATLALSA